ncbi:MAG: phosphoribosylamine--glycine ligase [Sphingobacteriales bacterium]|jgi:phosphoribosylamine--glycine ligase|nr:MAG: phosphoribosylamine--glycine ligase [Sphingobacteriales bacterium]
MNILLLGSGGREHAFASKLLQSSNCSQLYVSPGNAGTNAIAKNVKLDSFEEIKDFCIKNDIKMVVVGPEQPLVDGIYDFFVRDEMLKNIAIIGPSKAGAMLEGSKAYCKNFLVKHKIPTAQYKEITIENIDEGFQFLDTLTAPYVLKANGLAAGKGVLICSTLDEAKTELKSMLDGKFGNASNTVVIEEFMHGIEFSVFVLTDNDSYKILPIAKDYKRIGEGDTGLNTGGMGAISPPIFVTDDIMAIVEKTIIIPTIDGFKKDNIIYNGFVYIGIMLTPNNIPKVVEYNCRMGDPETQAVLPRIKSDLVETFLKLSDGKLNEIDFEIDEQACVTIVLASNGYPETFEKGKKITNLQQQENEFIFHAGTTLDNEGNIISSGGRVLTTSALGKNIQDALKKANTIAERVQFENKYYRKDIGFDM